MTTDTATTSSTSASPSSNQGMLLLEPYQPMVFMEDDWDNSPSPPPLTTDAQDDPFADMDFVDVSFAMPPTPSNSAPQSPSMPADKSMEDSAEELLTMLMQTYCPNINIQQQEAS